MKFFYWVCSDFTFAILVMCWTCNFLSWLSSTLCYTISIITWYLMTYQSLCSRYGISVYSNHRELIPLKVKENAVKCDSECDGMCHLPCDLSCNLFSFIIKFLMVSATLQWDITFPKPVVWLTMQSAYPEFIEQSLTWYVMSAFYHCAWNNHTNTHEGKCHENRFH